ncbi:hypothetical protein D3C76_829570 [compost metagenome]
MLEALQFFSERLGQCFAPRFTGQPQVLRLSADQQRQFFDLLFQAQLTHQVAANPAVGNQQIDTAKHQLAEVGFMGGGCFASETGRVVEGRAVDIAGRCAYAEASEVIQAGHCVPTAAGLKQHELDIRHGLRRVDQKRPARVDLKDIDNTVRQPLLDHRQAALPGQKLPFHLYTQALEDLGGDLVIDTSGLAFLLVDIWRPVVGHQAQAFGQGQRAQAGEQQDPEEADDGGHGPQITRSACSRPVRGGCSGLRRA